MVNCYEQDGAPPPDLAKHVALLDLMYPKIKITFLSLEAPFGPALVEWLSKELMVPKNSMFITCPDSRFQHELSHISGVRIITHVSGRYERQVDDARKSNHCLMRFLAVSWGCGRCQLRYNSLAFGSYAIAFAARALTGPSNPHHIKLSQGQPLNIITFSRPRI